jgi:type IV pilus assembly protein PilF
MARVWLAMLPLLALGGCAKLQQMLPSSPTEQGEFRASQDTSGGETDVRTRARLHTELAAGYFELGNMGVALEEVNIALRADANYAPAYNVAGLVYAELKEDRLAQQNFEQALRVNPLDSDANNNYGRFLCDRKREAEGIKYFLAALRNPLYENPDRSYLNAGMCSRRRGDIAAADDYLQKAIKLRPNQPQALYQLADMAYANGAYGQSKAYLTRLMQVSAPNAEVLWLGLRVERRLGDRDAMETYSMQLSRNFPESKEAQALIAGRFE